MKPPTVKINLNLKAVYMHTYTHMSFKGRTNSDSSVPDAVAVSTFRIVLDYLFCNKSATTGGTYI